MTKLPQHNLTFAILGFEGCIKEVKFDGNSLPFSGETDQFTIEVIGGVNTSCPAILAVEGGSGGLDIAIIIIIVFFVVVLIAIITTFLVCWYRRSRGGNKDTGFAFWTKKTPHINGDVITTSKSNGGKYSAIYNKKSAV